MSERVGKQQRLRESGQGMERRAEKARGIRGKGRHGKTERGMSEDERTKPMLVSLPSRSVLHGSLRVQ